MARLINKWQAISLLSTSRSFSSSSLQRNKVAVVLSGSGVYDGSEIHEASACLVHLSRHGAQVSIFAPDKPQLHVINHVKGEVMEGETRNVLVESARIARGAISSLSELKADSFDAVVFPGGFGAAKNLSSFAVDGDKMSVDEEVERVIQDFRKTKKPMGFCCISPVLAAKIIPGVQVTVGQDSEQDGKWPYSGTAGAIQVMGGQHNNREINEIHIDAKENVVTTPAFMCNAPVHEVYDGIGNLISTLVKMTRSS